MNRNRLFTALILATMLSFFYTPANGDVLIEPFGTAVFVPEGDQEAAQMMLTNAGNSDIEFELDFTYPEDERQNQGPRRDEFGERINFYNYPNRGWCGLAYNGEEIVAADWDAQRIYFWNIEEEDFVGDFGTNYTPWALDFDGENYWVATDSQNRLLRIDREGDQLDAINLGFTPCGVAWDGENLWTYPYAGDNNLRRLSPEGEELNRINCQNMPGVGCYALTWVPEHQDGHLWAISEGSILIQFNVDLEENAIEVIQQSQQQVAGGSYGITHDRENIWISNYAAVNQDWGFFVIDDGIAEISWLTYDPDEGLLEPGDEQQIELTFDPAGLEQGTHHLILQIELTDARRETTELVEMSMILNYMQQGATIWGNITDSETGEAVEGCYVEVNQYLMSRFSDEDGEYDFENLPLGDYQFTYSAVDYLPATLEIEFDEPGEFVRNIELLHAECNIDEEEIIAQLANDEQTMVSFNVANDGNGALTYQVARQLLGDNGADPWTFRLQYSVGEITGDSRIQGAVFVNDLFYIAGAGADNPTIYVMNRDGEVIDQFDQAGNGRYGYKDLAYDGELIWGSASDQIFGFRPNGDLVRTLESPCNPCNNITWDSQRELLWVSSTTTNIFGLDAEGNAVEVLDRGTLRIYGLAYWESDPDGFNLYIFNDDNEVADQIVTRMNTSTGESELVTILEPEGGGTPLSAFITNRFDIYSWLFITVANDGAEDRIDVWQLDEYRDWFVVEPTEGVIEAGEAQEFELTLDATGLPAVRYEGDLVFYHDGVDGISHLLVFLTVTDNQIGQQTLEFINGWTMVSAHLQPENPNIVDLCSDLVEQDILLMVKNGAGNFYSPAFNFNNIQGWEVAEGYLFKTNAESELTLEGEVVAPDQPIPLREGWHMISYYPRVPIDAIESMSGIVDDLELLKDGAGRFYSPRFNFSNMGDLQPGWGYLIKLSADVELVYPIEPQGEFLANHSNPEPETLSAQINTGSNMSLLITNSPPRFGLCGNEKYPHFPHSQLDWESSKLLKIMDSSFYRNEEQEWNSCLKPIPAQLDLRGGIKGGENSSNFHVARCSSLQEYSHKNCEIGVYANGILVGSGVISNNQCGIAIWGDDPTTETQDGALEGDILELRILGSDGEEPLTFETLTGQNKYETNGFWAIRLKERSSLPNEIELSGIYPNPFNSQTRISFSLPSDSDINLSIYTISGQLVKTLVKGNTKAGNQSIIWNGDKMASGVYLIRLESVVSSATQKVVLVR